MNLLPEVSQQSSWKHLSLFLRHLHTRKSTHYRVFVHKRSYSGILKSTKVKLPSCVRYIEIPINPASTELRG